jgi:hypothetical protein
VPGLVARVKNDRKKLMGKLVQEWGRYLFQRADREGQNCAINHNVWKLSSDLAGDCFVMD